MMLMLTLDDAVAVCMRFLHETTYFDDMAREEYESMPEFIRGEFEQKCWIPSDREPAERLYNLIFDINPAEICAQIEAGNLKKWCEIIQVEMNLAMVRLTSAQTPIKDAIEAIKDFFGNNGEFISSTCFRTKDGMDLINDWGYLEEGLDEIIEYSERRTE